MLPPLHRCLSCDATWDPRTHEGMGRCPRCRSRSVEVIVGVQRRGASWLPAIFVLGALGAGVAWGWARSHPAARERVVLARDCDVWAFDASGAATVIGRARAGEGFEVTAEDARSVRILRDGLPAWVVRDCAP